MSSPTAPSADCVNTQRGPGSGKGERLQPGLETHVKPNSNQMRLACFQRPLSIPGPARGRLVQIPSPGSRACLFPESPRAQTEQLTSALEAPFRRSKP